MQAADLLEVLRPTAERLLDRHLGLAKEWFPHEMVPWDRAPGAAADWDEERYPLAPAVRSALFVNLLTEDNLPYYFHVISRLFGEAEVWGEWSRRWTAEENRHSNVIRDWVTVTGALDPVELERARMVQVCTGFSGSTIDGAAEGMVYVTLQELATRISHRGTGRLLDDRAGEEIMGRVAADENLHFLFYRDLVTAALEVAPSVVVPAIEHQVATFEMPGTGIPDFGGHASAIAAAGIYDFAIHHDQILIPVILRHWALESLEGLTPEAEESRRRTLKRIERIGRVGRRMSARRDELAGAGVA